MARSPSIEAVTVDGFGTLLQLEHPVQRLGRALRAHGVTATEEEVGQAFQAEASYYRPRSHEGRDAASLAQLRLNCVGVFLRRLAVDIGPDAFVADFMGALRFDLVPGARGALELLRQRGILLACVANWDIGLHDELSRLEVTELFEVVVTSADAGVAKPDPAIFVRALSALGVEAPRSVHIGDEDVDSQGAEAAGMRFEPIPLATLPERLLGTMS